MKSEKPSELQAEGRVEGSGSAPCQVKACFENVGSAVLNTKDLYKRMLFDSLTKSWDNTNVDVPIGTFSFSLNGHLMHKKVPLRCYGIDNAYEANNLY